MGSKTGINFSSVGPLSIFYFAWESLLFPAIRGTSKYGLIKQEMKWNSDRLENGIEGLV